MGKVDIFWPDAQEIGDTATQAEQQPNQQLVPEVNGGRREAFNLRGGKAGFRAPVLL